MALVHEKYYIDEDLERKLATKEYTRNGSVVREAEGPKKGQIVMHLDPVEENNKMEKIVILVGVVAVVGVGVLIDKGVNKMKEAKNKFQIAFQDYIKDIENGDLSIESINRLMDAFKKIEKQKKCEKIKIELTVEEMNIFVNRVYEYTIKLASDNSVKLTNDELCASNNKIQDLQKCLQTQKRILEYAA